MKQILIRKNNIKVDDPLIGLAICKRIEKVFNNHEISYTKELNGEFQRWEMLHGLIHHTIIEKYHLMEHDLTLQINFLDVSTEDEDCYVQSVLVKIRKFKKEKYGFLDKLTDWLDESLIPLELDEISLEDIVCE